METGHGTKYRQLHIEDYLREIPAEQGRVTGVYAHERITGNTDTDTDFWTDNLLDAILRSDDFNAAYKRVKANKGPGGIDGMQADELLPYLRDHRDGLVRQLREGRYKPNPVRRVEIPKGETGKVRKLGIPTVVDRMVQQAIAQGLTPIYEEQFSDNSYGFRPGRSAHDALAKCRRYADQGYVYAISMDLQAYFDTVDHSKLIEVLSRTIKDGRVISLIHRYLKAGVMEDGGYHATPEGVPQGGPLSPLCGNVMLNELDKELERRGHKFVRYADDCMISCKSRKSAKRTLEHIIPFITGKLYLKINPEKTIVNHISKVEYLGYSFYRNKGKCRMRVHPKSIKKMKDQLRRLTERGNKWSNLEREEKLRNQPFEYLHDRQQGGACRGYERRAALYGQGNAGLCRPHPCQSGAHDRSGVCGACRLSHRRGMSEIKRLTPPQSRKVNALVRRTCCNCDNGNCILLDDGDECVCPQLISYSLLCKWFRIAVLPADKELYAELYHTEDMRRCSVCGAPFASSSNRAIYCPDCRKRITCRQTAERMRKMRANVTR